MSAETQGWRIVSENFSEAFKYRIVSGVGRETRPVALFMHLTDAETCVAGFAALAKLEDCEKRAQLIALEAMRQAEERSPS